MKKRRRKILVKTAEKVQEQSSKMFKNRRRPQGATGSQPGRRTRRGPAWLNRKKFKTNKEKRGPADCTVAELQQHQTHTQLSPNISFR